MSGKFVTMLNSLVKYSLQYACITHCLFEYVGDFVVVRHCDCWVIYKEINKIDNDGNTEHYLQNLLRAQKWVGFYVMKQSVQSCVKRIKENFKSLI